MRHVLGLVVFAAIVSACTSDEDPRAAFIGSYRETITVAGTSSQTYDDSLSITEGTTSDLILQSQQLGALHAKIISGTAFAIEQQQIMLSDGGTYSVTIQGQGTVTGGVFDANGTLASSQGSVSFTMAGSRL